MTDFVTLGSPLGLQGIIFDRLRPVPVDGVGDWPGPVRRWMNIADPGDIVAVVHELATRFGDAVKDESMTNGTRMHDLTRYLSAPKTGAAIALPLR